jgi:hypothetical protein
MISILDEGTDELKFLASGTGESEPLGIRTVKDVERVVDRTSPEAYNGRKKSTC